jgi:hypothetical protein
MVGVLIGGAITSYAQLALIGLMIIQVMTGVALIRLPTAMPQVYEQSSFKIGRRGLWFVSLTYIVFSILFFIVLARAEPQLLLVGLVFIAFGIAYYSVWTRICRKSTTTRSQS